MSGAPSLTGVDVAESLDQEASNDDSGADGETSDIADELGMAAKKRPRGKVIETYNQIRTWITAFIQV